MSYTQQHLHIIKCFFEVFYRPNPVIKPIQKVLNRQRNHECAILLALVAKQPVKVKNLRKYVYCSTRSFDACIARLKAEDLIEIDTNEEDKRSKCVQLTSLGRESLKKFLDQVIKTLSN